MSSSLSAPAAVLSRPARPGAAGSRAPVSSYSAVLAPPSARAPLAARLRAAAPRRRCTLTRAVAAPAAPSGARFDAVDDYTNVPRSGLNGQALRFPDVLPSKAEVLAAIPAHCFKRDTAKSLAYAAVSLAMTLGTAALAAAFLPLQASWWPAWVAYALVNGTIATGCWVVAHECGHNAFSDNRTLQDAVGYALHSALLVPYFSWQRSHAVHHARTNHVSEGETHCPYVWPDELPGRAGISARAKIGAPLFACVQLVTHLLVGWPAYLLWGATGGSSRGVTNHFWPVAPFSDKLWPGTWKEKVWKSDVGVVAVLAALVAWGVQAGAMPVLALYCGPYLVTNAWLVLYTWLQHTDVDVPHHQGEDWSFVRGAFLTVDRPYGPIFDFLHHRIGSTHVAHHVESSIPHYHALEATHALKKAFPELYLYDPTPILPALWRVASQCVAVQKRGSKYVFISQEPQGTPALA